MKKKQIFIFAIAALLCSCESWDLHMTSNHPSYSGTGEASIIRGQLVASYSSLMSSSMFGGYYWGDIGCIDTDEGFRHKVSTNTSLLNAHNITSSTSSVLSLWRALWQCNESATDVLSMLTTVENMDSSEMAETEGQALVLQAFAHYYAAINYGPVPIKNVPTYDMGLNTALPREPVKNVLQFALDNCRKAIPLLPDMTVTKNTATISKSAAEALSYRIALYMASHPDIQDVAKYDSIVKWSNNFIANGPNKLNTTPMLINGDTIPAYARLFVNNMANDASWNSTLNPEGIWDIIFYCKSTQYGIYADQGYSVVQRLGRDMGVPCADASTNSVIGYADYTYSASNNLYNKYTDFNGGKDYPVGDQRRDWNIPTFCYKYRSTDDLAMGNTVKTRFPYFDVLFPSDITCTKKAVLIPVFDKSSWYRSETTANINGIYIEDGGSGYRNANGDSTFSVTIPKASSKLTSMKFLDPSVGAVVGYASGASPDSKADGYEVINCKNTSSNVTFDIQNGVIVDVKSSSKTIGSFTGVHARGIGKWRREYEINVPEQRMKDYTSCNFPVLRFADVLLMAAEANLMASSGDKAKGLEYLNMVRRRAYGQDVNTPNTAVDFQNLTLQEVKDERMRELCFEGVRRFDLLRWGSYTATDDTNVITQFLDANPNHTNIIYPMTQMRDNFSKFQVFPIPQNEVSISPNTMWQNPGW